ncbi:MAG: hypothetical protein K2P78_04185 [Gemmataceae bacterium]|nr:hypothetical protein [Gemmataceae bacterium]
MRFGPGCACCATGLRCPSGCKSLTDDYTGSSWTYPAALVGTVIEENAQCSGSGWLGMSVRFAFDPRLGYYVGSGLRPAPWNMTVYFLLRVWCPGSETHPLTNSSLANSVLLFAPFGTSSYPIGSELKLDEATSCVPFSLTARWQFGTEGSCAPGGEIKMLITE